jgi:uncharacterized protein YidB (DUF937 family)
LLSLSARQILEKQLCIAGIHGGYLLADFTRSRNSTETHQTRSKVMGLFDQIAGLFGGGSEATPTSGPLAIVQMLASQEGGLAGILQQFQSAGLGGVVQSWVGGGENAPISADTVHQVLGSDFVQQLAGKLGIPADQASSLIAEHLPQVVDGLTPNGEVPQHTGNDLLSLGAGLLKSRFGIG